MSKLTAVILCLGVAQRIIISPCKCTHGDDVATSCNKYRC